VSKNVAVFVDVANIFYAAKAAGADIDYVTLLKAAVAGRDFVRAYAYTGLDPENENQRNFHSFLARHGYKVVSKDIRKYGDGKVKANLDIELVVDMMKTARNLDVAIVVSGDGDFAPAIRAVQEMGVRVEVISFRGNTSSDLIEVADAFYDITQVARVDHDSSRSGRRVAGDDEDLSMTEVPDKITEGRGGRGRGGRGRGRTGRSEGIEEAVVVAPRAERPAGRVLASRPAPRSGGRLVALPGEKLSRATGSDEGAPVDEELLDDTLAAEVLAGEIAAGEIAAGEIADIEAAEGGENADSTGRRRRRRGGRGRGHGRSGESLGEAGEGEAGEAPAGEAGRVSRWAKRARAKPVRLLRARPMRAKPLRAKPLRAKPLRAKATHLRRDLCDRTSSDRCGTRRSAWPVGPRERSARPRSPLTRTISPSRRFPNTCLPSDIEAATPLAVVAAEAGAETAESGVRMPRPSSGNALVGRRPLRPLRRRPAIRSRHASPSLSHSDAVMSGRSASRGPCRSAAEDCLAAVVEIRRSPGARSRRSLRNCCALSSPRS